MTANSQLSTTEPKTTMKTNTKQTTRTGTEPEIWTSCEGFQWGRGGEEWRGKVQGIRSMVGRHKIDRERLRMV